LSAREELFALGLRDERQLQLRQITMPAQEVETRADPDRRGAQLAVSRDHIHGRRRSI